MGLLAVAHFSRMKSLSTGVTRVLALSLRTLGEKERLTEETLLDWWRLRVAVEVATSHFSAMHWLSFSCTLLGDVFLVLFSGACLCCCRALAAV